MEHYALGIDIGGTNSTFGVVNRSGEVLHEHNLKTNDYPDAQSLLQAIKNHLLEKGALENLLGIGVGAPNGNSHTGNIEFAPNLPWKGIVPFARIAEDIFHRPTLLINDANAAAIGEKMFGKAKKLTDFVTITLGTGLGSGVFVRNQLLEGKHGFAGEYGHIRVIPNGRKCGCGRSGCLETYASSTGVLKTLRERLNAQNAEKYKGYDAHQLFAAAQKGDDLCLEIVDFTAEILGNSLADFACFSDPHAYILFGGLAHSGTFFQKKVQASMDQHLLEIFKGKITVLVSDLHDRNAAVLGTAATIFWSKI